MIPRYQTREMSALWDDAERLRRWTLVEVAACEGFHGRGEIPDVEMSAIRCANVPAPERVREIERTTNHDVVAFVRAFSENVGAPASRHLHRGLTSSDVVDTALATTLRDALEVLIESTLRLRRVVGHRAREHAHTVCVGRTHGVHAEPTTFGCKLAGWHCELSRAVERLRVVRRDISYGKMSGAVGTFSQTDPEFERAVLSRLGLEPEPVATQVVPRDRHASVVGALALLTASLERFATEIRSLQRTEIREVEEPFAEGQTGSSAMPHKRNPVVCERVCGIARLLRGWLVAAMEDVALWHERDISHSSVERVILPDAFQATHYALLRFCEVVEGMRVFPEAMRANLDRTRGLVFSQGVLGMLLGKGIGRQEAYEAVQRAAAAVWEGRAGDFREALLVDPALREREDAADFDAALDPAAYLRHVDALLARAGLED